MKLFFTSTLPLFLALASAAKTAENAGLRAKALVEGVAVTDASGNDACANVLNVITGFANDALAPLASTVKGLDPLLLDDVRVIQLADYAIPGTSCVAAANLTLDIGRITGLGLTDVSVVLVDDADSKCEIDWWGEGSFSATWRLQKTLTNLALTVSGHLQSEACGKGFDGKVAGSVTLPHAGLSADFSLGGGVSISGGAMAEIDVAELVKIDVDLPSYVVSANLQSVLGNTGVEQELESWVKEDTISRVSGEIISIVNDNIAGFLPLTLPPPSTD